MDSVDEHLANLTKKQRNYEKFRNDRAVKEMEGCTFKPALNKKKSLAFLKRKQSKSMLEVDEPRVSEFKTSGGE